MKKKSRYNRSGVDLDKIAKNMKKQEAKKRKKDQASEKQKEQESNNKEVVVDLAKTTKLVFFRQYNTYQALLEVYPRRGLHSEDVYAKVILYIMRWFRNRLGEDVFEIYPDISFLRDEYPEPSDYKDFNIDEVSNINGFDFINFETAFLINKKAWVVHLSEPDNGQERKDIQGRTFTTEISVYKRKESVVLGIRESCREPESNTEDAFGYRPGFVRDIFYDENLFVTEEGLDKEFAFAHEPYMLNGKSLEASKYLYDNLIVSNGRQMPILFVPGDYYATNKDEVDKKTVSLLGYCHVVVWESKCRKLFEQTMASDELLEGAESGRLIFYRTNSLQEYPSDFFEPNADEVLDKIKKVAQNEPLRKFCDFKDYLFKPSWWDGIETSIYDKDEIDELSNKFEADISILNNKISDLERDSDHLQRQINNLKNNNKNLNKNLAKIQSSYNRLKEIQDGAFSERDNAKDILKEYRDRLTEEENRNRTLIRETKRMYLPVVSLPSLAQDNKKDIIKWIDRYYSDILVVHPSAEKSLLNEKRNIDLHRLCMMIHFIAGYTKHRNDGGLAKDDNAVREYDVEDAGYKVEPTGSGQGALNIHKDKYTIDITENNKVSRQLLDMHLKYGKGSDKNMIRIYFYYSPEEKKSFIGYMPGHLPTRKDSH